jgi:serine/threonine protein kinase
MPFAAPQGTVFVAPLGAGTACDVARVRTDGPDGGHELACKRLLPQHRASHEARVALVREARALELARHPAIPALRGVGSDEAGPFVLETLVEGPSLRDLKHHWSARVPSSLARHVVGRATLLLGELHALADDAGSIALVHGDVGPDNLRLGACGEVGLLDFGNARTRAFTPELDTHAVGTAPYLAPELARGDATPTPSTDVYALAATAAWLLLEGEQPLVSTTTDAATLLVLGERGLDPERLAPLPPPLRDLLASMLAFDPATRTADLAALHDLLV